MTQLLETVGERQVDRVDAIFESARRREKEMLENAQKSELTAAEMRLMLHECLQQNPEALNAIHKSRREIAAVQLGLSNKGVFISGQCSPDMRPLEDGRYPAYEVPHALHENAQRHVDSLVHIPRVCWKKPRSSAGPAGLYHEQGGATFALREVYLPLVQAGVPFAYEFLDPNDPLQDCASYAWLGARSVGHNALWYPLSANATCPAGLKNGEAGRFHKVDDAANAIRSRTTVQAALPGYEATIITSGNSFVNSIYRGGELVKLGLEDPGEIREAFQQGYKDFCRTSYKHHMRVMLDISHGNAKLFTRGARDERGQLDCFDAFEDLLQQNPTIVRYGEMNAPRDITVKDVTMGAMAEVSWLPGRNNAEEGVIAGRSDVDACLGLGQGIDLQKRMAELFDDGKNDIPLWIDHPAFQEV
ncbi:MAG: hypothetical protein PVI21_03470 [Candidatus Woesebacteria bacterium]|jgi:phospho-2-dehydro-3-deoxyheptonate aldolase